MGSPGHVPNPDAQGGTPSPTLFASRSPEKAPVPLVAWIVAALAVLLLLGGLLLVSHPGKPPASANSLLPLAPDASKLLLSGVTMSESTSLSGGKSTYIDGVVANQGKGTVTGLTVQVLFANDESLPPQIETLPLNLIRTRQPYVDVEPVSAEPLAPGAQHEFRLIFEDVAANWNQQVPQIRVVGVTTR